MKVKKSVQSLVLVLAICVIGLAYIMIAREEHRFDFDEKAIQIPLPDKILIYKNGKSYEVDSSSKDFTKIYKYCNEIRNQSTMESAIDNDIVEEIKSQIAVEYVYSEKKCMRLNACEREYTKLLFDLEGKDNVILYDLGYKSGTYKLDINKLLMRTRLQKAVRKIERSL